MEEAKKLIEEDKEEYTIPLKITAPKKTIGDLGEEAFPDLLATFSTIYDASNRNRSTNKELHILEAKLFQILVAGYANFLQHCIIQHYLQTWKLLKEVTIYF